MEYLGEALPLKLVEFLVLKGLADLHNPVRPEVEDNHRIPILQTPGAGPSSIHASFGSHLRCLIGRQG